MKKILILLVALVLIISGCQGNDQADYAVSVAVSIPPQAAFVKAVGGDLVKVTSMIPPGGNPATYEPSPKEMAALSEADLYLSIGVATEKANILPKLADFNAGVKTIPLWTLVNHQYPSLYLEDHHHDEEEDHEEEEMLDPHIWLSPKRVMVMIEIIRDELIKQDPNNEKLYEENAQAYLEKLTELDQDIKQALIPLEERTFIIYHPAFGYFAHDYDLEMVTIEEDGKEATAKRLQDVVDFALENNIKFVFYQAEFDDRQATTIAKEIGGSTVKVAPLAENYLENMYEILEAFQSTLQ